MLRHWFDKPLTQYAVLFLILAGALYYWGFIFDFGYKFDWSVLYERNSTYGEILGFNLLEGLKLKKKYP